jgi:hypothetical protein
LADVPSYEQPSRASKEVLDPDEGHPATDACVNPASAERRFLKEVVAILNEIAILQRMKWSSVCRGQAPREV